MEDSYSIIILDSHGKKFGELMNASRTDIMAYINKGFNIIDRATNQQLTMESVADTLGVSDGCIMLG